MSGHNGGTHGTRRPLGAVDPNDERFVPATVDLKASAPAVSGVHKPSSLATPHKHTGLSAPVSSTVKKRRPAVLGKAGGLRVLVDHQNPSKTGASASDAGEWRHKYEHMLLEKTRLESDLRAKQALVDELKAKMSTMEQYTRRQHGDDSDSGSPLKKRRRVESESENNDKMEMASKSSEHEEPMMSDTIGEQTTDVAGDADAEGGGGDHQTATIAESMASALASEQPQVVDKTPQAKVEQSAAAPKDEVTPEDAVEETCMGVPVQHEAAPRELDDLESAHGDQRDSVSDTRNTREAKATESTPTAQPVAHTPQLTLGQMLRFEALSRLPAHHDLTPVDASPEEVIAHLRGEIQKLKANRTEEMNALKTYQRELDLSDRENRALQQNAEALESEVKELVPLHAFVVESEILRECEQIDANRLREELAESRAELSESRGDGARAHRSIKVLGEAFHSKLKSHRERIKRLRESEKGQRARADEGAFAYEVAVQQIADERARVRETYDEKIDALEARIAELQKEHRSERTAHEALQHELMCDNEKHRREVNRLRAQLKRKRRSSATGDTSTETASKPSKRPRTLSTPSKQYSQTPPPPSTLQRSSSLARIPVSELSAAASSSSSSPRRPRKHPRDERDDEERETPEAVSTPPETSPAQITSNSRSDTSSTVEQKESGDSGQEEKAYSFSESLRLVRQASDTMFARVRELKSHLAEIQELLAETPSEGDGAFDVSALKAKLSSGVETQESE